jgi:hypothetical protein
MENGISPPERPSWIAKIDVEGFETRVVRGMANSLRAQAFAGLVIEINEFTLSFCGSSSNELREVIQALGYREEIIAPGSGNSFFVPAGSVSSRGLR